MNDDNKSQTTTHNQKLLTQASIQEIQLELIRRWNFNEFDGEEVFADLIYNRHLWRGVLMDSLIPLVKLRDMVEEDDDDFWNVDTLYIWATDKTEAKHLLELGEKWRANSAEICSLEEVNELMGTLGMTECYLVKMWWD